MSKYYWNEYVKYYIDDTELTEVLKLTSVFSAPLVTRNQTYDVKKCTHLATSFPACSDVGIKFYLFKELRGKVRELVFALKDIYKEMDVITGFPLIVLKKEEHVLGKGIYSINFQNSQLIMISEDVPEEMCKENDVLLAFFLNIDLCVAWDGIRGFLRGIEETGGVIGILRTKILINEIEINMPRRALARDLGVNIRKCLLMDVFAV